MNIFEKYIQPDKILIILFKNQKDKCINNIYKSNKKRNEVYDSISYMSKIYNINLYQKYSNNILILDVYQ